MERTGPVFSERSWTSTFTRARFYVWAGPVGAREWFARKKHGLAIVNMSSLRPGGEKTGEADLVWRVPRPRTMGAVHSRLTKLRIGEKENWAPQHGIRVNCRRGPGPDRAEHRVSRTFLQPGRVQSAAEKEALLLGTRAGTPRGGCGQSSRVWPSPDSSFLTGARTIEKSNGGMNICDEGSNGPALGDDRLA